MNWYDRIGRWAEERRAQVDVVGTLLALLVVVPMAMSMTSGYVDFGLGYGPTATRPVLALFAVATVAPLAVRRTRPVLSVVLVYTATLVQMLSGIPILLPANLFILVAVFSIAVYGPRWAHLAAIGTGLVGCGLLGAMLGLASGPGNVVYATVFSMVFIGLMFIATWAFGLVRRARRETYTALRDRTERLEVERDQQARIATAAERSRIAREMHDIVAHSLSVMIAQADGGRYAASHDPEAASRTLGTISETGRAALADMRRLLGVLRDDPDDARGDGGAAERTPQPAAGDITALVEQVRASGMRVSLVRMGTARTLPPGTGLTLYRICQEALTNILKHAGPDPSVTVVVTWERRGVKVEIDDDGRGASADSDGAGQGLLGMRERAAMFGGTVTSGPRPGGGFRVMLDLPLPEPSPRSTDA
ncbi:signal transduction histidine kinase [Sanguibacter keddieii DSM 10542]|uniref:histidine kinase n=1 Tax=Sanguibacter keddieii (strain ATCC 51767 / DSM 10542 / NCFB 3025 / ST-74) TaxID=446469 RepID=D1BC21_SANKS|nr:sensor histidine kinase [Sanguibacter keddieii]ACZ20801.1 signal transduction histidine kinase [Sanguibacter keddieii DSM 10542]